jgi:hypothetical protein
MAVRRLRFGLCLPFAALVAAACVMHEPGTSLGTYAVTGTLAKQTCGAGVTPDDPWLFDVRLSRSSHTLYWLQDSAPPISGNIDSQGNAIIEGRSTFDLQPPNDAGLGYCGVVRTDDFTAALGAMAMSGTAPASFTGTLTYHYDVAAYKLAAAKK